MKTVQLTKEKVDEIIDGADNPVTGFFDFHRFFYENWEDIKKLNGFIKCNECTNDYILSRLQDKGTDLVEVGMFWVQYGFSSEEYLSDWEFELPDYTLKGDD